MRRKPAKQVKKRAERSIKKPGKRRSTTTKAEVWKNPAEAFLPDPAVSLARIRLPSGRPLLLTQLIIDQVSKILRNTGTLEDAAKVTGIAARTLKDWRRLGRTEESGLYRDFRTATEAAIVERRFAREAIILEAGKKDWRATMALMQCSEPLRYAPRIIVRVQEEITHAAKRLEEAFADEPELLERAIAAIVGGDSSGETGDEDDGPERADDSGSEAVQPPPAESKAVDIPPA